MGETTGISWTDSWSLVSVLVMMELQRRRGNRDDARALPGVVRGGEAVTISYKLLNKDRTSHGGCKWEPGEWKETSGNGELCGPGWLHFYSHPLLAAMLNPIHANRSKPVLWEAETEGARNDDCGLKHGVTRARIVREIPLPTVTTAQRVRFGILCSLEAPQGDAYKEWAARWLSGEDRSYTAASSVARSSATYAAAYAAAAAAAAAYDRSSAAYAAAACAGHSAAAYVLDLVALAERAIAEEIEVKP